MTAISIKYVLTGLVILVILAVVGIGLGVWKVLSRKRRVKWVTIKNDTDTDVTFGSASSDRTGNPECDIKANNIVIPRRDSVNIGRLRMSTAWISPTVKNVTFLNSSGKIVPYTKNTIPPSACPKGPGGHGEEVMAYTFPNKNRSYDSVSTLVDVRKIYIG